MIKMYKIANDYTVYWVLAHEEDDKIAQMKAICRGYFGYSADTIAELAWGVSAVNADEVVEIDMEAQYSSPNSKQAIRHTAEEWIAIHRDKTPPLRRFIVLRGCSW